MHQNLRRTLAGVAAAAAVTLSPVVAGAGDQDATAQRGRQPDCSATESGRRGRSLAVVGLTADSKLVCFDEFTPQNTSEIGTVVGLTGGDTLLVGIDFRPATTELIGLGNAGGVYVLDTADASATLKSRLNVVLEGTNFGVDFNPTVDRLRVVGDAGQNLRVNVDTGVTTVDAPLNYLGPPVTTAVGVTGAAYTNNDASANTATTLFDIDSTLDQVVVQAPPNAGTLNPTGKLGIDTGPSVGFDIHSRIRNGASTDNRALASLGSGETLRLYEVDVLTGDVRNRGNFRMAVVDIAIPPNQL